MRVKLTGAWPPTVFLLVQLHAVEIDLDKRSCTVACWGSGLTLPAEVPVFGLGLGFFMSYSGTDCWPRG